MKNLARKRIQKAKQILNLTIDPGINVILQNLCSSRNPLLEKVEAALHALKTLKAETTRFYPLEEHLISQDEFLDNSPLQTILTENIISESLMPKWVERNLTAVMWQLERAKTFLEKKEFKVGDYVRLIAIPEDVEKEEDVNSTNMCTIEIGSQPIDNNEMQDLIIYNRQLFHRLLISRRPHKVLSVDSRGIEIMVYHTDSNGQRVYDYLLIEPKYLDLV